MQKKTTKSPVTLDAIGKLLDEKLEEKLDKKLEEKLDQKLEQKLTEKFDLFTIEMREEIQLSEARTEEKARQFRDDIFNKVDSFVGRVVQVEENQEVGDHQIKEKFAEHEERIIKLEKLQGVI